MQAPANLGRLAVSIFLLAVGFAAGFFVDSKRDFPLSRVVREVNESGQSYFYVNPLLYCGDQNTVSDLTASSIQDTVAKYFNTAKREGRMLDGSMYYRDLKNGPWAGVNVDMQTPPASLLKVPLAMSLYKYAEGRPAFLGQTFLYDSRGIDANAGEHIKAAESITSGKSYSVEELIQYMLRDSDNGAMTLLAGSVQIDELTNSFKTIGVPPPQGDGNKYAINARVFGSFFRVLYNASYLSPDDSEHMLGILAGSGFDEGIVAGVPKGTRVAHKFGERSLEDGSTFLNDCGIVYRSDHPYLICIFTKGRDAQDLVSSVRDVSKIVYDLVETEAAE